MKPRMSIIETMPEIDLVTWLLFILLIGFIYTLILPYQLRLQARVGVGQLKKSVRELEGWALESRKIALKSITKHGRTRRDVEKDFDNFLEFFAIEPVSADPAGVIGRLDHILDVRKRRYESAIQRFAPNAKPEEAANLEMTIEGAAAGHLLFRLIRHFTIMAEKTKNIQLTMIIQMNLPFLRELAKSFAVATRAFSEGKPIGDGVGPLTVTRLAKGGKWKEAVEDTVYVETKLDGRKLLIVKAKGPGGRVGKPGELIANLAKGRKVSRIIMIDAAGKLEGEESGGVIEGVGAAIGGPPTEKYKIEQIATKKKIPVDALIIKESFTEAIVPLHRKLAKGTEVAAEMIRGAIKDRTKPGDTVIVAGIGNTIGIGQLPEEIPEEFPAPPVREKGALESTILPGVGG